jgi:hypothetical protein
MIKTPMCQEYLGLRLMWIRKAYKSESWMEELNELAQNAKEPEVKE